MRTFVLKFILVLIFPLALTAQEIEFIKFLNYEVSDFIESDNGFLLGTGKDY